MSNFTTIWSFDDYVSAHIALGRLEEDGIKGWLKDENMVTIDPILSIAVGGIKLMVSRDDAQKAREILESINREAKAAHPCPKCGSKNVDLVSTPRKAGNWFSFLIAFFTVTKPMPVNRTYHCFNCGNEYPFILTEENKD